MLGRAVTGSVRKGECWKGEGRVTGRAKGE